ncbi:putative ATPase, AAA family domain-containing protein [Neospora caninum Liverpool]|uniref:Putative ATPase, AAA family domain-containing protein n=1 Tax=Neospora caninum (strain Liverpool) TaxID=572307 RepID=F0V9N9_NEOCL|nr:putative ATPase, AAA family domain-containing protein [Neospora caninum Liverpool]CBZ50465.1 putative ATPase, AAA family domain-containing protein [Neospora caninum Liverpool]|eukprot:XP_003880498.1 putative ATPase, AAA family domain-containing protein [Neospora caninum Liverpool]
MHIYACIYTAGRYYNLLPPVPPSVWGRERRREPPSFSRVTFADVAGHGEAKKQLRQVIQFLRSPQAFDALGARAPRGILLEGPTGTGKTLLARAVAGESSVPFLSISGGSFVELYVGQGAARVRALFEAAKAQAPCVVFIDEFDAIALDRKECIGEREQKNKGKQGRKREKEDKEQGEEKAEMRLDGMERPSGGGLHSAGLRGARGSDPTLEKASFAASEASACAPSYEKETTPASFLASLKRALAFPLFFPFLHRSATPRGSSDARGNCEAPSPSQDSPSALPPPIVVLAATNRVAALDEAVKRPGRFDIIVRIDLPSEGERFQALKLHSAPLVVSASVDFHALAHSTSGFSGAELEGLCNEAALGASREGRVAVGAEDFAAALETFQRRKGRTPRRRDAARQRQQVANHRQGGATDPREERDDKEECERREKETELLDLVRAWVRAVGERDSTCDANPRA